MCIAFLKLSFVSNLNLDRCFMSITKKEVNHIADLAHLQLSAEESEDLVREMDRILDYIGSLQEVDTSGVAPLQHPVELEYRLRKDESKEPLDHEEALKNAPDADTDYFRVPRVLD